MMRSPIQKYPRPPAPFLVALAALALLWPALSATSEAQRKQTQRRTNGKRRAKRAAAGLHWIWGGKPGERDRYVFRKEFTAHAKSAKLTAVCDNRMVVSINGKRVATSDDWNAPVRRDVTDVLVKGKNVIVVEASNAGGPAGLALRLSLKNADGKRQAIVTNTTWRAAQRKGADEWKPVISVGRMGDKPWGNVFARGPRVSLPVVRGKFQTLPGFKVEEIYKVPKATQGSWVSITFDDKGRLIASDQGNKGLFRITPPPIGNDKPPKVEKLSVRMSAAQGMLSAFGSLYVSVNGGQGSGLYRLRNTDGDDQYDEVKKLKALRGGGEHGPHALRLSPDGKSIYQIAGNHTFPPDNFNASRLPSNWGEDLLLPRQWDARGHARGKLAPGGWIAKTDPEGKTWEIVSSGYRNSYDFDINADGELFAYDADMEWDFGTPWYRPTRVVHAASGSEFGWRSGTGKWPTYFPDSLPPMVEIGPGSPVGVTFGYGTKFPAKYQKALFILDWTFGTIYAIHITPQGSSYTATKEEFLSRTPLPLTDAAVGPDGAVYFTIGGRGTDSALYRVTYTGQESTKPVNAKNEAFADLRALRRRLEKLHHKGAGVKRLDLIWKNLGHEDRFIRYAARLALEHVPVKLWQERALAETDPETSIQAIIALARQGEKSLQPKAVAALGRLKFAVLSETQQLSALRAYALVFIRLGRPDAVDAAKIARMLDPFYPAKTDNLNRELCRVLVYLNSPTVIDKTLKLMKHPDTRKPEDIKKLLARNARYGTTIARMFANLPEIQNIHYAFVLRNMRYGWTLEQRKEYFAWIEKARTRSGGMSYRGFIDNIRREALDNVSPAERKALASTVLQPPPKPADLPKPKGPGKNWTVEDILAAGKGGLQGRSFEGGKRAYAAARCIVCHRFDGNGAATGPDLTNVAGRFSLKDLSESLINPSKVVSDQYRAHIIVTTKGKSYTGRIASEANGLITLLTDPEDARKVVKIPKGQVDIKQPSKTSLMPRDLLKPLNKDELLDLLAFLMSRGNPQDPIFRKE
ncbi:MAG: c-type cytochrome [Planctomycetaceae bacterium]